MHISKELSLPRTKNKFDFWLPNPTQNLHTYSNVISRKQLLPEVLFITSFPPRECGIATYSNDLIEALNQQFQKSFITSVCALESDDEQHTYHPKPKFVLNTDHRNSFIKMAFAISRDAQIKVVVVQHEFGFFAENKTEFNSMIAQIAQPIVFVLHTILPLPNDDQMKEIQFLSAKATTVVVMTNNSANILTDHYQIPVEKITVIPHGSHLVTAIDRNVLKKKYSVANKKILSTFGLLGLSKSIETTLEAMPSIVKSHPDVLFLVLGKTHPSIIKNEGEVYRKMLEAKVKNLKIRTGHSLHRSAICRQYPRKYRKYRN